MLRPGSYEGLPVLITLVLLMPKHHYTIKIENPCSQEWGSMLASDQGRYCSHCTKSVIDFTKLSDEEVLKLVLGKESKLCGRLRQDQLNRSMLQAGETKNGSRLYKILASLLLLTTAGSASAQTSQTKPQVVSTDNTNSPPIQTPVQQKQTSGTVKNSVSGKVIDLETKEPLSFAIVSIKNSKVNTMTDANGNFQIVIPDSLLKEINVLEVRQVGYEPGEFLAKKSDLPLAKAVALIEARSVMLGVMVLEKRKWWQIRKRH